MSNKKEPSVKKTTRKKMINVTTNVEYHGNSISANDAVNKCIEHYFSKEENTGKEIVDIKIYLKPEDNKIYYVINESEADAVTLF